jgi:hypothetical protein
VSEESHDAYCVKSLVVLSEYIPVAVNDCVVPAAIDESSGVMERERSAAELVVAGVTLAPPPHDETTRRSTNSKKPVCALCGVRIESPSSFLIKKPPDV